jgi:spore coat protein U-like protein
VKKHKLVALRAIGATAALAGVLVIPAANAGPSPQSSSFVVRASVPDRCNIDAANDLNFGIIDPEATTQQTSTIAYRCTSGTTPVVALDYTGTMSSASTGTTLDYTLYQEGSYSTVWRTGPEANISVDAGTGLGAAQQKSATVYGQVTQAQATNAGVATDFQETVTVTFTF